MACQFIEGYREQNSPQGAQPELAIPGLEAEEKRRVNRPVAVLPLADETEIIEKSNRAQEVAHSAVDRHGDKPIESLNDAIAHFQSDAPTCPNCGHVAVRNGACYKCLNCGESLGCS